MLYGGALPEKLGGEHYRFDDFETEFFGLKGRSEGLALSLQDEDGQWDEVAASDIFGVPNAIRLAFGEDIANGNGDRIGMLIVPRVGGLVLRHFGIFQQDVLTDKRITETNSFVGIAGVKMSDHRMSDRKLEVRVSKDLDANRILTATSDGTLL